MPGSLLQVALLLVVAAWVGAAAPALRRWSERGLHTLVAVSAGVFLGSVAHLLLEVGIVGGAPLEALGLHAGHAEHANAAHPLAWGTLALGFLAPFGLRRLLARRAPGDRHALAWRATYLGLSLHALLMGLGLAGAFAVEGAALALAAALAVHKAVECFTLAAVMRLARVPTLRAVAWIVAFSFLTPVGLGLGELLVLEVGDLALHATAFSAGMFLYVALLDLLPEAFHVRGGRARQAAWVAGGLALGGGLPLLPVGFAVESATLAWTVFVEMAPFLVVGFAVAGLLSRWLRPERFRRWLGRENLRSVATASIVGAPLPLCSCSVVPVAASLRRGGAGRGATSAFLIATPETGVDSIAASAALLDPLLTVARPLSAVASAVATGVAVSAAGPGRAVAPEPEPAASTTCCRPESPCDATDAAAADAEPERPSWRATARFAAVDLVDDLAWPLVLGVLVSGVLGALLPDALFESALATAPLSYLLMLAIGLPIYVCAAASTPIAAMLLIQGLSPGAALVFLLASPATNLGSLIVLKRLLGLRGAWVHVLVLAAVTVLCGALLDAVYGWTGYEPFARLGAEDHLLPEFVYPVSAALLLALLGGSLWRRLRPRGGGDDHGTPPPAWSDAPTPERERVGA